MYFKFGNVHNNFVEVASVQITCLTGWLVSDSIMQGRRNVGGSPPPPPKKRHIKVELLSK